MVDPPGWGITQELDDIDTTTFVCTSFLPLFTAVLASCQLSASCLSAPETVFRNWQPHLLLPLPCLSLVYSHVLRRTLTYTAPPATASTSPTTSGTLASIRQIEYFGVEKRSLQYPPPSSSASSSSTLGLHTWVVSPSRCFIACHSCLDCASSIRAPLFTGDHSRRCFEH
ncbi:hypothetical protein IF2G_04381 [Cordyceps javanica]|nr:hypothetical protein IF2G_04381 [Cordyceps javanica]